MRHMGSEDTAKAGAHACCCCGKSALLAAYATAVVRRYLSLTGHRSIRCTNLHLSSVWGLQTGLVASPVGKVTALVDVKCRCAPARPAASKHGS